MYCYDEIIFELGSPIRRHQSLLSQRSNTLVDTGNSLVKYIAIKFTNDKTWKANWLNVWIVAKPYTLQKVSMGYVAGVLAYENVLSGGLSSCGWGTNSEVLMPEKGLKSNVEMVFNRLMFGQILIFVYIHFIYPGWLGKLELLQMIFHWFSCLSSQPWIAR